MSTSAENCDYCGTAIKVARSDCEFPGYWEFQVFGFRCCDGCLPSVSKEFPELEGDKRLWALRLLEVHGVNIQKMAEAMAATTQGGRVDGMSRIDELLETSFKLFQDGDRLAAMYAGVAAQNLALLAWDIGQTAPVFENAIKAWNDRKRGAVTRHANDPKQAAKEQAFAKWKQWQSGHTSYRSNAAFARHIVDTTPIESTKSVERWVKEWRSESVAGKGLC